MVIKSSLGFSINADLRSQNNLRGLIAVGVEPVNFVTADNSVKSLSIEQLNTLIEECSLNGQNLYQQKWNYREQIENATTVEELKEDKLDELTGITSKFDNQLVNTDMVIKSSLDFTINADLRSQNNLRGLIAVGVEPVNFVTADNSVKSLSIEQLNTLIEECSLNGQNLYQQKWNYREQIENATTVEELNSIEFNFEMKDFSK